MNPAVDPSASLTHQLIEAIERVDVASGRGFEVLEPMFGLYAADVVFEDPMQRTEGLPAFIDLNQRLIQHARELRFYVENWAEDPSRGTSFLTWRLVFRPKVPMAPRLTIQGVTHLQIVDGKITLHRDYWDLLSSLAGTLPVLNTVYRVVMAKFA